MFFIGMHLCATYLKLVLLVTSADKVMSKFHALLSQCLHTVFQIDTNDADSLELYCSNFMVFIMLIKLLSFFQYYK